MVPFYGEIGGGGGNDTGLLGDGKTISASVFIWLLQPLLAPFIQVLNHLLPKADLSRSALLAIYITLSLGLVLLWSLAAGFELALISRKFRKQDAKLR